MWNAGLLDDLCRFLLTHGCSARHFGYTNVRTTSPVWLSVNIGAVEMCADEAGEFWEDMLDSCGPFFMLVVVVSVQLTVAYTKAFSKGFLAQVSLSAYFSSVNGNLGLY